MAERSENFTPFRARPTDRTMSGLLSDLARQTGLLMQQEVALAKAEIFAKLGQMGSGAGMLAAGGLIAFAGFLSLMAAAVLGLAIVVAPWLAALIVGVGVVMLGGILIWLGKSRMQAGNLIPERTIRSLKDDAEWVREQLE